MVHALSPCHRSGLRTRQHRQQVQLGPTRCIVIARSFQIGETFASVVAYRSCRITQFFMQSLVKRLRQLRSSCSRLNLIEGSCEHRYTPSPRYRGYTRYSFPEDGFKFIHSDYNRTSFYIRQVPVRFLYIIIFKLSRGLRETLHRKIRI